MGMLWLAYHNPEIDWRTGDMKMTRCLEKCGKQEKSGWQEEEKKKRKEKEQKEKKERKTKN